MSLRACIRAIAIRSFAVSAGLGLAGCSGVGFNPYATYQRTDPANPEVRDEVQPGRFVVAVTGKVDPVILQTLLSDAVRGSGGGIVTRVTEPSSDPKVTARWQVEGFSGNVRGLLSRLLPERHVVDADRIEIDMQETQITLTAASLVQRSTIAQAR